MVLHLANHIVHQYIWWRATARLSPTGNI